MQSIPIIEEASSQIAMDIIGPLYRTSCGNIYFLEICEYAARYPEASLLKSINAETTSEAVVEVFTRFGIPQELLTDQGSNLMADLMQIYLSCYMLHISRPAHITLIQMAWRSALMEP